MESFFAQDTLSVARQLCGKTLTYQSKHGLVGGVITETEAYTQDDPASHTFQGKRTSRNAPMYMAAGHIYIYFIYGMYHCLNFVTESDGVGAAVLIRSIQPTIGLDIIQNNRPNVRQMKDLCNGPGKLMMGLNMDTSLNGDSLMSEHCPIKLDGCSATQVNRLPRIGIRKAQDFLWRFQCIQG